MKNVCFVFISTLFTVLAGPAFAQSMNWTLVKKNAGPAMWVCPMRVHTVISEGHFSLNSEGKATTIYMDLTRLNTGVFCYRHQNGTIFGTLKCIDQTVEYNKANTVYPIDDCSSDLPFVSSCAPEYDNPGKTATISANGTLIFHEVINWGDDHSFECQYKAD